MVFSNPGKVLVDHVGEHLWVVAAELAAELVGLLVGIVERISIYCTCNSAI
jgi:hypothetical protein